MSSSLLQQTQALLAAHSKAIAEAVALGHSLGVLASSADARVAEAAAEASKGAAGDGDAALAALADAIGPGGALTQQLAALHAQWAGLAVAAVQPFAVDPTAASPAAPPLVL